MNIRMVALVLGATMMGTGIAAATACSSGSGSGTPGGGGSSGGDASFSSSGSGSSSGGGSSSGISGGSSSGSSSGSSGGGSSSGVVCKDPNLHQTDGGSIYCGFTDAGSFDCPTGQQCCLGGKMGNGYAPEMCAQWGSTCTNGMNPIPIECEQPQDCQANNAANAACCLVGASAPAMVSGCDAKDLKSQGGSAVSCIGDAGGACPMGDMQVCEAPGDCPQGKTCTPIHWKLYQIGVCL